MHVTTKQKTTIGIDLGDRYSQVCVLDEHGEVLEEGRVMTKPDAFRQRFGGCPPCTIAIEAGTPSPWVTEVLKTAGHEVLVANPRKLRMIFRNESKNDRFDAMQLARVDPRLLHPIEHRGHAARVDLAVVRARDGLVRSRTQLINHVRSTLKSFGHRLTRCSTTTFGRRAARQIPKELRPALVPILRMTETLTDQIRGYDRKIEKLCEDKYRETAVLRQVSGVGALTALTFLLTLANPRRFSSSRAVGAYLGLRPRQRQSGERDPELRITKAGNRELRRLLVQSAQYILGPFGKDSDLKRFGCAIAARGCKIAKRRAVVAVARKLAVLLHRLWLTGEVYEPLRNNASAAASCEQPAALTLVSTGG